MKLKEITNCIESVAPLAFQESYDNSGLLIGNENSEINGVLICIDCTEEIIDEAIRKKCNLVLAHHPIIFEGLKKITGKNYIQRTILKAIKNDIAIYAAHTNLDNLANGVNKKIADKIGLINTKILSPKNNFLRKLVTFCPTEHADKVRNALFSAGAGTIGNYEMCSFNATGFGTFKGNKAAQPFVGKKGQLHAENEVKIESIFPFYLEEKIISKLIETHPYEEVAYDIYALENKFLTVGSGMIGELPKKEKVMSFLSRIKKTMQTDCIRYTKFSKEKEKDIKTVAICGGSGSFLLSDAIAAKADIFITADFKYHQFFDAENSLIIADIGHYESEQFTKELFYDILIEKFPKFALHLSKTNTNPINYL